MTANAQPGVLEEARIIVANPDLCATVTEYFMDAGIAASGDYRDDSDSVLIRDAFEDGVEYVIFANVWHILAPPNFLRKSNRDLIVKVYSRGKDQVQTMKFGAAIQMILERRNI